MMLTRPFIALSSLALCLSACSSDDTSTSETTETTETSGTSGTSTTTGTTAAETETGTGTGSTSTSTSSTTAGSTTTTTTTTTGDTTTTTTGDTTTTGGLDFPVCDEFCDAIATCVGITDPECLLDCYDYSGFFHALGPVCTEAIDDVLLCAADLDCIELGAFLDDQPSSCDDTLVEINGEPPKCFVDEEPPAFCTTYCDKTEECMIAEPDCLPNCKGAYGYGNTMSPECSGAVEDYFSCLGALDCENLMNPITCLDKNTQIELLCDF